MNTSFKDIVIEAIRREGGFVNHPNDRGGATNMGVTIGCLKEHGIDVDGDGDIDSDDVKALPVKTAMRLYLEEYWKPGKVNRVPGQLREFYFDMIINHGPGNAVAILQKTVNKENGNDEDIKVDGKIGPITLGAIKYLDLRPVVYERIYFFSVIRHNDPSQRVFYDGWLNRCFQFLD